MIRNPSKIAALICAGALGLGLAACSSAPDAKADAAKSQNRIATPYQVQKPSAEELANSPCGNPDWAQLPEGAEKKAQPDAAPADAAPPGDDTSSKEPQSSDAHARGSSSLPRIKPCT